MDLDGGFGGDDGLFADDDGVAGVGDGEPLSSAVLGADGAPVAGSAGASASAAAAAAAGKGKAVEPSQRITTRYMTKYERARLLGTRALQLR
jgi:DNA-directed RNA polymerase I, II, and III subunit RPABC2